MEEKPNIDKAHQWELLLRPGVFWFIWEDEDILTFCLPSDDRSQDFSECMQVEKIFPPDIAFLLHEIISDASEMKPGENKKVRVVIPGTDSSWNAHLSLLSSGRFCIIWSKKGSGSHEPDYCDIQEHVRSERAVRKANEKLNYFNAIVRHDIVNLMMGIVGYIDIIDEIISDEEVRLLLRKSRDLGERIRRIAELTRTYQNLGVKPPVFIEGESVVTKMIERHEFAGKISAHLNLSGLMLYVDRLFDVVIYELVKNSLQYGGDGVNISFSYDSVPEGMLLIIEDNGPGVKPECKERIFMRNYADRRGYGLYLAAEILDITGVKISETGVFGEGARFELIFPPDTFRLEN